MKKRIHILLLCLSSHAGFGAISNALMIPLKKSILIPNVKSNFFSELFLATVSAGTVAYLMTKAGENKALTDQQLSSINTVLVDQPTRSIKDIAPEKILILMVLGYGLYVGAKSLWAYNHKKPQQTYNPEQNNNPIPSTSTRTPYIKHTPPHKSSARTHYNPRLHCFD